MPLLALAHEQVVRRAMLWPPPPDVIAPLMPLQALVLAMRSYAEEGKRQKMVAVAEKAAPFLHARLVQSDVRVQHTFADRDDIELTQELLAIEQRLLLSQTIESEAETVTVSEGSGVSFNSDETVTD